MNASKRSGEQAPKAQRAPLKSSRFGHDWHDDYAWLKDENWQRVMHEPETLQDNIREHLEAENAYTEAFFHDDVPLYQELVQEMRARIREDDSSVPLQDGAYMYYSRYEVGGEYPIFARRHVGSCDFDAAVEEVLIDGVARGRDADYFSLGTVTHSPCHRYIAFSVDWSGNEYYHVHVIDTTTGQELARIIEKCSGTVVWGAHSHSLFYVHVDDNHRTTDVFEHVIDWTGNTPSEDRHLYHESDPGFFVSLGLTQSERFLVISAHDHETSDVRVMEMADETRTLHQVLERNSGHEYRLAHWEDRFFVLSNAQGAVDFQILSCSVESVISGEVSERSVDQWVRVVPHVAGRFITSMDCLRGTLIFGVRENARTDVCLLDLPLEDGAVPRRIPFDEETYALGFSLGYRYEDDTIRLHYSSLATPSQVIGYHLGTGTKTVLKTQMIPSGHDVTDYVVERLWARAEDGAEIPVSLVRRKDVARDGHAPVLLYGYGSYGISIPPSFSTTRFSLIDRGVIYAIAHVRGGTEKGYQWYLDAKRSTKTRTFRDFIAVASHLVDEGYTSPKRIVAHGGSAGGMLMGAIANMRPDLFAGIIADVPFVDVLHTMSDASLPLTPPEWPEWGNPIEDEAAFHEILSYCPYMNVTQQAYPAIFALGGLSDPRVTYWEPAKWVAKLRAHTTSDAPILLKINMSAGHGGASGRFSALDEVAYRTLFALKVLDLV